MSWHPRELIFAVAGEDNLVTVNSLDGTRCAYREGRRFTSAAWHPDQDVLAVGCADGTIVLLRMTGELTRIGELSGHSNEINSVGWSPDGRSLLSASNDRTARVWDPWTGAQRTALIGHSGPVTAAVWAGSDTVFTGSADNTLREWNVLDGFTHPLSGAATGMEINDLIAEARRRIS